MATAPATPGAARYWQRAQPARMPARAMTPPPASAAEDLLRIAPVAMLHLGADAVLLGANAAARDLLGDPAPFGRRWGDLFAAVSVSAGPQTGTPQSLALRHDPGRALQAHASALPAGGWLVALLPPPLPEREWPQATALALAADLADIAVWHHDLATDLVHYSERARQVLGVQPRPAGVPLAEARERVHPDALPQLLRSVEAALQGTTPVDFEALFRSADGTWRRVMTRRVVQRNARGEPLAFVGVALDVTARQQQQLQAHEMTRRFEMATAAAGIGCWSRAHGEWRATWNPALREISGLAPNDPVPDRDTWLTCHVHPEDRKAVQQAFESLRNGAAGSDSLALSLRLVRPDGRVRHVSTLSAVERAGPQRLMFGVVIDLTERHLAELALRSARERAALAARGAGLGTWEFDLATGATHWDEQMWLLRGHAPRPGAMSEAQRLACVHPDDRHTVAHRLAEALSGSAPLEHQFRIVRPDGQVRWLASRSTEVRDEDSGARRRIGVNWDITELRSAEAERREREIAQRESLAKSRFLARMSHELRTPLNAVLGFTQLLLEGGSGNPAGDRRQLEHVHHAGEHLLTLINDVLDLSGLESGELRITLQPVALAPLVAQTLPMLASLCERHGVRIELGPLEGAVVADATRLRQVLLNLLSNAVKYNRRGGVAHLSARPLGQALEISVADTGQGMSAEQLERLFEPFNRLGQQGDGAHGVEGSGIGLTIVKALVTRMHGQVQVSSTPGAGSRFDLRLPAAPEGACAPCDTPAPRPARAAAAPAGLAVRGQLLYIEDNPVNALILSELITRRPDLRLHVAPDGATGLQQALALQPDLVLLDMQLPDGDGLDVLQRLRAEPALAQVPVVALSANAMPEDIRRALDAGLDGYLTKPLDFGAFLALMTQHFGPPPA